MFRLLSLLACVILSIPLVAGFLGAIHPAFDSFAHFRLHLAVLLAVAALPVLLSRCWRHGALALLLAAAAWTSTTGLPALGIGPVHAGFHERQAASESYRLLHLNLRFDHREPERVLALIDNVKPDFVLLAEVSAMWSDRLRSLMNAYPYQVRCRSRSPSGGVAILSRLPFSAERMSVCADDGSMAIATAALDERLVDLSVVHLRWPWPYGQPRHIGTLSPLLERLGHDAILTGDFNAAPWSHAARRVASAAELTPMRPVGPTWLFRWMPAWLRPWIGLPLDQVHAKGDIVLYAGQRLADAGSDHLPILVEFGVTATGATSEAMVAALP